MGRTLIDLARQSYVKNHIVGQKPDGTDDNGNLRIAKGTQPASTVIFTNEGSSHFLGDVNIDGKLTFNGEINQANKTELQVDDFTVRVNKGGTTATANGGAGVIVEGDNGTILTSFLYKLGKWFAGDPTVAANEVATVGATQTLTGKTLTDPTINNGIANTPVPSDNSTALSTTAFVSTAVAAILATITQSVNNQIGALPYFRETAITGTQDGVNTVFTLGNVLATGSEVISNNGELLRRGATNDYTLSTTNNVMSVTFVNGTQPIGTDGLRIMGVY